MLTSSARVTGLTGLVGAVGIFVLGAIAACGNDGATPPNDRDGGGTGDLDAGDLDGSFDDDGGRFHLPPIGDASRGDGGGIACPTGLQCNVACSDGGTTTLRGKVYDPAGKNPLYNVAVYVPATPLTPLPRGVPTGNDACDCSALFRSGALAQASTDESGSFTLTHVPVGNSVPLVLQVGKWRRLVKVDVAACADATVPDRTLTLPGTVAAGDTDDSMPDIAVSTGSADSLECLMRRIGLPASEYVAGTGTTGHVHVFSGGTAGGGALGNVGKPESNPMPGAPASPTSLWANKGQLMPFDIVLLSCEGGETYDANPGALEEYLNAGGRAFASHFHYSWFSGPLDTTQSYAAPADWGSHLATWSAGGGQSTAAIGGVIDQTLNGSTKEFTKGKALDNWLGDVSALGKSGVPAAQLSIYQARYNAAVSAANPVSQPWITAGASGQSGSTMYFSFDTPVGAVAPPDGGAPPYCGRAVFSDLHVAGDPMTNDSSPPPGGCASGDLSPQEKALEFMLFDLSSCVISDTVAPDAGGPGPPH